MVSRTFGKQIIFGILFIGFFAGLIFYVQQISKSDNFIYPATDSALDLAVLDGIVKTDGGFKIKGEGVRAVVVPHHLVASEPIAVGIRLMASSSPNLIVIISPDHFGRCAKLLCTTRGVFRSFFGDVSVSEKDVLELEKNSELVDNSRLFSEEHGIFTVVPFLKHYIPNAEIIPIVMSQKGNGSEKERAEVIDLLKPLLSRKDVGLVISSDFSHYLPLKGSKEMDTKTQNSFCAGNDGEILDLKNPSQSDCPLCLWLLEQEAKNLGFWNPVLIAHTNSAEILKDLSVKETTSHFVFTLLSSPTTKNCPLISY
ncbi:MAG: AmmeMemoRadiSam system protein B [bacterium]